MQQHLLFQNRHGSWQAWSTPRKSVSGRQYGDYHSLRCLSFANFALCRRSTSLLDRSVRQCYGSSDPVPRITEILNSGPLTMRVLLASLLLLWYVSSPEQDQGLKCHAVTEARDENLKGIMLEALNNDHSPSFCLEGKGIVSSQPP